MAHLHGKDDSELSMADLITKYIIGRVWIHHSYCRPSESNIRSVSKPGVTQMSRFIAKDGYLEMYPCILRIPQGEEPPSEEERRASNCLKGPVTTYKMLIVDGLHRHAAVAQLEKEKRGRHQSGMVTDAFHHTSHCSMHVSPLPIFITTSSTHCSSGLTRQSSPNCDSHLVSLSSCTYVC